VYTHRGSGYTADVTFRRRLNDFYTDVNRTPEISLNALRQPVGQSGLYYESKSSAGYLEKVWMKSLTNSADYSALRLDSSQMIYYPDMYAGFLSVIPRAGYRLTYYSKTRDQQIVMVDTNAVTEEVEEGPGLRTRPELGTEVSYKAFKTWKGGVISPLRHIAEPYCNYTLAPEPNLLPERLYQFDNVDTLRKDHSLKIGMRNIWQTKHGDLPFDLVDLDTYTRLRIEPNQGEQTWDYFYYDAVVTPSDWLRLKFDGSYDLYGDGFETFNGQATVSQLTNAWTGAAWKAQVEYRLKRGESSLLAFDTTLSPNRRWDLNVNARYEFEDRRLEEIGAFVQRNLDCMAIQPGLNFRPGYTAADGSTRKDEWRFMVEFWLTAFPKARIGNR
jgi:hypothetical protein